MFTNDLISNSYERNDAKRQHPPRTKITHHVTDKAISCTVWCIVFHFSTMVLLPLCLLITGAAAAGNFPYHHGNLPLRHDNIAQQLNQLGSINQTSLVPLLTNLLKSLDMETVLDNAVRNLGNSSTCLTKLNTLASFSNPAESIAYFDTLGKPASGLTRDIPGFNFLGSYDECV